MTIAFVTALGLAILFAPVGVGLLARRKNRNFVAWPLVTLGGSLITGVLVYPEAPLGEAYGAGTVLFLIPALLVLAFLPYRCRLCGQNLPARESKAGKCIGCRELPVVRQQADVLTQETRESPDSQSNRSMQWYLKQRGDLHGPIAHVELLKLVAAGHIVADDLLWRAGFAEWLRAANVEGIFSPPAGSSTTQSAIGDATSLRAARLGSPKSRETNFETAQAKRPNYFVRHWRGELSLPITYWVNSFFISIIFAATVFVLTASLDVTRQPTATAWMLIGTWIAAFIVCVWQLVGIWRSARYHPSRGGSGVWAVLARFMVVLGACNVGAQFINSGAPQINELLEIAAGDESMSGYSVRVLRDARELEITGPIGFGLSKEVSRALDNHPTVRLVHLNSNGGRIAEARRLAKLIAERHLITYTAARCESACVLAFAAGSPRLIGPEATIGLHQPSFPGLEAAELAAEVKQDRAYLRSRGVSETFLDAAFSTPSESMWRPSHRELIAAGLVTRKALPNEVALSGIGLDQIDKLDQLIQENPLFAALRDHEPEAFVEVQQEMIDSLLRGVSVVELRERVGPDVRAAVQKRLATSSDDAILQFGGILIEQLRVLRATDPQLCYEFAYIETPRSAIRAIALFPEELRLRELAASAEVIRSSAASLGRTVDHDAAAQDSERLFNKLAPRYGKDLALLAESIHPREKRAELCGMILTLFEQTLELPRPRAANSLRAAFASIEEEPGALTASTYGEPVPLPTQALPTKLGSVFDDLPPASPTERERWWNAPLISERPHESDLPPLPPGATLDSPAP